MYDTPWPVCATAVVRWNAHPLGYGATWATLATPAHVIWRGPHALALDLSPLPCAVVACDANWVVVEERIDPAVLRERYRLRRADWVQLAAMAGYRGDPWVIADAAVWTAVSELITTVARLHQQSAVQRQLLRDAYDLLGIHAFSPLAELPSRLELRNRIIQALVEDEDDAST